MVAVVKTVVASCLSDLWRNSEDLGGRMVMVLLLLTLVERMRSPW